MHAASPAMGRLPILHLLLLLIGLGPQAHQAQGRPLTSCSIDKHQYLSKIKEIRQHLNPNSLPLNGPKNPEEVGILMDKSILSTNLDAFLNATNYFQEENLPQIKKNLQDFKSLLPTPTPMAYSIHIREDWDDFQMKLNKYLHVLYEFLTELCS